MLFSFISSLERIYWFIMDWVMKFSRNKAPMELLNSYNQLLKFDLKNSTPFNIFLVIKTSIQIVRTRLWTIFHGHKWFWIISAAADRFYHIFLWIFSILQDFWWKRVEKMSTSEHISLIWWMRMQPNINTWKNVAFILFLFTVVKRSE